MVGIEIPGIWVRVHTIRLYVVTSLGKVSTEIDRAQGIGCRKLNLFPDLMPGFSSESSGAEKAGGKGKSYQEKKRKISSFSTSLIVSTGGTRRVIGIQFCT